jgi:hypothetical protein
MPIMKKRKSGMPSVGILPIFPKTTVNISVVKTCGMTNQNGPSTVCV